MKILVEVPDHLAEALGEHGEWNVLAVKVAPKKLSETLSSASAARKDWQEKVKSFPVKSWTITEEQS